MYRARSALRDPAPKFGSGESKLIAQDPKEGHLLFCIGFNRRAIDCKLNGHRAKPSLDTRELEMQRNLRQRNVQIGCVDDGTTKIGHDECDVFIDRGQNTDIENDELGVELIEQNEELR